MAKRRTREGTRTEGITSRASRLAAGVLAATLVVAGVDVSAQPAPAEAYGRRPIDCNPGEDGKSACAEGASTSTLVYPAAVQPGAEPHGFWSSLRASTPAGVSTRTGAGFLARTGNGVKEVWGGGRDDLFVPGYIWHTPWQYSGDQLVRYNTAAWGIGYGRTMLDPKGNKRTLFAMVSADSYGRPQYMAGYAWRKMWRPGNGALRLGAGYTPLVIGRSDRLHYAPIPVALPLGSIGIERLELFGAYVPGFEVGYFFAKVGLR
jgi:lipid IVA palmitoyltransferase